VNPLNPVSPSLFLPVSDRLVDAGLAVAVAQCIKAVVGGGAEPRRPHLGRCPIVTPAVRGRKFRIAELIPELSRGLALKL
jgi:hypothetical protein